MIELKYVEKRYPGSRMRLNINELSFQKGEIVAIVGANGSGKTTLLKTIMGIGGAKYPYGHILIDGKPPEQQYHKLSFITEEGSYLPHMTPEQYALFLSDFYPAFNHARFANLLEYFELAPDQVIKTMSTGQRSKLEICAGFSKNAEYIIMDEPFNGKDMFTRRDFLKLMIASLKEEETILLTTHIVDEIENVIDRAIILHQGLVKADITMDELREQGISLADKMADITGYKPNRINKFID